MYCIQCGTLQTAGAVYCKICGARLSEQKMDPTYRVQNIPSGAYVPPMYGAPEDPTPTRIFVEAKHSGKRCPVCGKSMPVNAAFCVSCGYGLRPARPEAADRSYAARAVHRSARKGHPLRTAVLVAAVLLLLSTAAFVLAATVSELCPNGTSQFFALVESAAALF